MDDEVPFLTFAPFDVWLLNEAANQRFTANCNTNGELRFVELYNGTESLGLFWHDWTLKKVSEKNDITTFELKFNDGKTLGAKVIAQTESAKKLMEHMKEVKGQQEQLKKLGY